MPTDILAPNPVAEKIEQALTILRSVGVPVRELTKRRKERAAMALLAVANLTPDMPWAQAKSFFDGGPKPITTRDVIRFWNAHYGQNIADSSYDDVRRKDLLILVEAGLVARSAADPTADINDGTRGYAILKEPLALIRSYGGEGWEDQLLSFRQGVKGLTDKLSKARAFKLVPVTLPDGTSYRLSPGPHNKIQKAIIEVFLPRFSQGAHVLYLGDAEKKVLHLDKEKLNALGIKELSREMLPDVLAYEPARNWLFVIEAVHSSNPIGKLRHLALSRLTRNATAKSTFISAFATKATFQSSQKKSVGKRTCG